MGYQVSWGIFSASEVGAPHQRKRVFILAHLIDERLQGRLCGRTHQEWKDINGYAGCSGAGSGIWPSRPGEHQYGWEPPRVVGNAESQRSSTQRAKHEGFGGELCAASASGESVVGNAAEQGLSERGCGEIHESRSVEELKRPDQIVGNAKSGMPRESGAGDWGESVRGASEAGQLGNIDCGRQSSGIDTGSCSKTIGRWEGNIEQTECGQTEPTLGRYANGSARGMDYAELCVTCDNRTDELRLLGNGVVPATATRAFLTLVEELNESPSLPTSSR
jgi:site-specific DNA-cytosine methylase